MKRREFLKAAAPPALVLPAVINGFSVKAIAADSGLLQGLMGNTADTDKVLVIIQLSGGNDGLNTVIPIDGYANYRNARPNIAIQQSKLLSLNGTPATGLHPAMTGLQSLFNDGKLAIVQAVGYPAPSFSHFRATDIWMSGSDSNAVVNTGWAGRYLHTEFPNYPNGFPNATMPDPLAIQIGSITSLDLQGPSASMGISISDPNNFYNLINGVVDPVPATPWGKELSYIRLIAQQTQSYATGIKKAAAVVTSQGAYPAGNDLAAQLKIVARLVKGGLKTRVYMVSTGGFDTHSAQADSMDTSVGNHAKLLAKVSDAIKAFMDDLKGLGIDERVIGMTFSEFGRRIKSNSSTGTDHGAAAPMFIFGKKVQSGVVGANPLIPANVTVNDNIPYQYDFRSVYASLLNQWFCVNAMELQTILFKNFQNIPLCTNNACGSNALDDLYRNAGNKLIINYPNPFTDSTTITFKTSGGHTLVHIMDTTGRSVLTLADREYTAGVYNIRFDATGLPPGVYYARLQNGTLQQVRPMMKVRQ